MSKNFSVALALVTGGERLYFFCSPSGLHYWTRCLDHAYRFPYSSVDDHRVTDRWVDKIKYDLVNSQMSDPPYRELMVENQRFALYLPPDYRFELVPLRLPAGNPMK